MTVRIVPITMTNIDAARRPMCRAERHASSVLPYSISLYWQHDAQGKVCRYFLKLISSVPSPRLTIYFLLFGLDADTARDHLLAAQLRDSSQLMVVNAAYRDCRRELTSQFS